MSDAFARPQAAPLLLLVPALWLLLRRLDVGRRRRLARVVGPRAPVLAAELGRGRRRARRRLLLAGLLLAVLALMQPLWGEGLQHVERRGVDVVVCLDVSRSMLARDLPGSRLDHAKRGIRELAGRVRDDRLGLVVFAGEARRVVPLTRDVRSLVELLEPIDPWSIRRGGTDLGAALDAALATLAGDPAGHETVLLLTDGEDLGQRGLVAAGRCRDRGVTVHCVGLGSTEGSRIPLEDPEGGFLRGPTGAEVVSALDPSALRRIADATGGVYVQARPGRAGLREVYEEHVLSVARRSHEAEERAARGNRFQWPLLAAYLLWIIELCLTDRRRS